MPSLFKAIPQDMDITEIDKKLHHIRASIARTLVTYRRPSDSVTLVAVTKAQPIEKVTSVIATSQTHLAESYLQEALPKIQAFPNSDLIWHYIGRIQSNKIKHIATNFAWVESVATYETAILLNQYRPDTMPPLNVCIQVNLQQEPSKNGILPEDTLFLAQKIQSLPKLKLRGLMAIPLPVTEFNEQVATFRVLSNLFWQLRHHGLDVNTLSMGMSADYEAAIAAGATMIRIGSAIFGKREP